MHFYTTNASRGQRRLLEQRKFRYLGQLQTMRSIYTRYMETDYDMDIITGDKLYSLIYMQVTEMNKCQIN